MTIVESLTADVLARTHGDAGVLRQIIDRLDRELNVGPLERTMRLWDRFARRENATRRSACR